MHSINHIDHIVDDSISEIKKYLGSDDWVAFTVCSRRYYDMTSQEELKCKIDQTKGIKWCIRHNHLGAVKEILKIDKVSFDPYITLLYACVYDALNIIKWLLDECGYVKVCLGHAAVVSLFYGSNTCFEYLIPLLDINRRYRCSTHIPIPSKYSLFLIPCIDFSNPHNFSTSSKSKIEDFVWDRNKLVEKCQVGGEILEFDSDRLGSLIADRILAHA